MKQKIPIDFSVNVKAQQFYLGQAARSAGMDLARGLASYVALKVSGKDSPGKVVLHLRRGSVRNPGQADGEDIAEVLRPYLPKPTYTGKVIINTGLGGLAHKEHPFLFA